jgi:hypothetical protein
VDDQISRTAKSQNALEFSLKRFVLYGQNGAILIMQTVCDLTGGVLLAITDRLQKNMI